MKEYPSIVKLLIDEDGCEHTSKDWHLSYSMSGDPAVLCTGEFYGYGQGRVEQEGVDYIAKTGRVTCRKCISIIKDLKAVRL